MRDDSVPGRAERRTRRPVRRGGALGLAAAPARAEIPGGVVRIGVPTDRHGGTAENSGQGPVPAAESAARDADGRGVARVTGRRARLAASPNARGGRRGRRLGRGDHAGGEGGTGGVFRPDGDDPRALYNLASREVKSPEEGRGAWDDERPVARTPAAEAFRPLADGGCPMSGKT